MITILVGCIALIAGLAVGMSLGLSKRVFKVLFPETDARAVQLNTKPTTAAPGGGVVLLGAARRENAILLGQWVRHVERRQGFAVLTTETGNEHWFDGRAVQLAVLALGEAALRERQN